MPKFNTTNCQTNFAHDDILRVPLAPFDERGVYDNCMLHIPTVIAVFSFCIVLQVLATGLSIVAYMTSPKKSIRFMMLSWILENLVMICCLLAIMLDAPFFSWLFMTLAFFASFALIIPSVIWVVIEVFIGSMKNISSAYYGKSHKNKVILSTESFTDDYFIKITFLFSMLSSFGVGFCYMYYSIATILPNLDRTAHIEFYKAGCVFSGLSTFFSVIGFTRCLSLYISEIETITKNVATTNDSKIAQEAVLKLVQKLKLVKLILIQSCAFAPLVWILNATILPIYVTYVSTIVVLQGLGLQYGVLYMFMPQTTINKIRRVFGLRERTIQVSNSNSVTPNNSSNPHTSNSPVNNAIVNKRNTQVSDNVSGNNFEELNANVKVESENDLESSQGP